MTRLLYETRTDTLALEKAVDRTGQPLPDESAPLPGAPCYNPYGRNQLCCQLPFSSGSQSFAYAYTVKGRTRETDFAYSSQVYRRDPMISIIGLYATRDTEVSISLFGQDGSTYAYRLSTSRWETVDFGPHQLTVDITIIDPAMAQASVAEGWLFNGYYADAYDQNGDVRVLGLVDIPFPNISLKYRDGLLYVPAGFSKAAEYYSSRIDLLTLMGECIYSYPMPEGLAHHHDLTWDDQGNLYCLATIVEKGTPSCKREAHILKFDGQSRQMVAMKDYSTWYEGSSCVCYAAPNDVHFNSIDFAEGIGQLIVNSRSSSSYFGIDTKSLQPLWTVENPAHASVLPEKTLQVKTPEHFTHISGAHTAFVCRNRKYDAYRGKNRLVLMIFDNRACVGVDGEELFAPNEKVKDQDLGQPWDSQVQIVAVDLEAGTVSELDRFGMPGVRSSITSSVFDTEDRKYLQVYFGVPTDYYVIDPETGKAGVVAKQMRGEHPFASCYRGRVLPYEAICGMVERSGKEGCI